MALFFADHLYRAEEPSLKTTLAGQPWAQGYPSFPFYFSQVVNFWFDVDRFSFSFFFFLLSHFFCEKSSTVDLVKPLGT